MTDCDHLKKLIREVPDFPKPGILFYDITTLLKDRPGFRDVIDGLEGSLPGRRGRHGDRHRSARIHLRSRAGLCAGRRLRARAQAEEAALGNASASAIDLEYGTDSLEIHKDAIARGHRVLIVDDLLATGGTAAAVTQTGRAGRRQSRRASASSSS